MANQDQEHTKLALQVIARAGATKLERQARFLDYRDQLREARRKQRMLEKGY